MDRRDAHEMLRRVLAVEMGLALEQRTSLERRVPVAGKAAEQPPRRGVILGDRRDKVRDVQLGGPGEQIVDHAARQALATPAGRDRDLPDEQRARIGRWTMTRNPADRTPRRLRDDALLCEMLALDEIAVTGISIERRTGRDQCRDGGTVGRTRTTQMDVFRKRLALCSSP